MTAHDRYLKPQIIKDLERKMVFVGGPRQVGKTTLAKSLLGSSKSGYLNWDIAADREVIYKHQLPVAPLLIFDEMHKFPDWRNYLKGVYDQHHEQYQILVTGSARLDIYRRGGDSLQGRYHYLHMHPLSFAELKLSTREEFADLLMLGGFPEPYFSAEKTEARRWSREYRSRILEEDVSDLERVEDITKLERLMIRLPELVGSPLSINSLREDLGSSHKAVSRWINIFENLYAIFRVSPFSSNILRAVKKEQKHYHFDWTLVTDEGARFENCVACHLLKWVDYQCDVNARELRLCYFRDVDRREVDFIITEDGQPILAIECKSNDNDVSKPLIYFKERFKSCRAIQISAKGEKHYISRDAIEVMPVSLFLRDLI